MLFFSAKGRNQENKFWSQYYLSVIIIASRDIFV